MPIIVNGIQTNLKSHLLSKLNLAKIRTFIEKMSIKIINKAHFKVIKYVINKS